MESIKDLKSIPLSLLSLIFSRKKFNAEEMSAVQQNYVNECYEKRRSEIQADIEYAANNNSNVNAVAYQITDTMCVIYDKIQAWFTEHGFNCNVVSVDELDIKLLIIKW